MTREDVWHQCSEFYRSGLGVPAIWLFCVFVFNENYGKTCRKFLKEKVLICGAFPATRKTEEKFRDENITVYHNFNLIYILISNFRMRTLTSKGLEVESEVDAAQ